VKKTIITINHGLFDWKINQKPITLTFSQFDPLVILKKLIWTHPTRLMVFFTNREMVFLTNEIGQKIGQPKNFNLKNNSICIYKNIKNK